ncbi:hypothetical protein EDC01DRAFT_777597 [Geopyxis carbonaria]|nr:hypothetical protein EDC01DRAFT_777597 [Geopyxis carbonaria]
MSIPGPEPGRRESVKTLWGLLRSETATSRANTSASANYDHEPCQDCGMHHRKNEHPMQSEAKSPARGSQHPTGNDGPEESTEIVSKETADEIKALFKDGKKSLGENIGKDDNKEDHKDEEKTYDHPACVGCGHHHHIGRRHTWKIPKSSPSPEAVVEEKNTVTMVSYRRTPTPPLGPPKNDDEVRHRAFVARMAEVHAKALAERLETERLDRKQMERDKIPYNVKQPPRARLVIGVNLLVAQPLTNFKKLAREYKISIGRLQPDGSEWPDPEEEAKKAAESENGELENCEPEKSEDEGTEEQRSEEDDDKSPFAMFRSASWKPAPARPEVVSPIPEEEEETIPIRRVSDKDLLTPPAITNDASRVTTPKLHLDIGYYPPVDAGDSDADIPEEKVVLQVGAGLGADLDKRDRPASFLSAFSDEEHQEDVSEAPVMVEVNSGA